MLETTTPKSPKGKLNKRDFKRGALLAVIPAVTVGFGPLIAVLTGGSVPELSDLVSGCCTFVGVAVSSLLTYLGVNLKTGNGATKK